MSHSGGPPGSPGPRERSTPVCVCERTCVCVCERSSGRNQRIRHHMRDVMEQLEYVLAELKDVARELQEVVGQIDKLTGDIDLDADECTAASEREPSDTHTDTHTDTLHHPSQDALSDSCSSRAVPENPLLGSKTELGGNQPQMVPSGRAQVNGRNCFTPNSPRGSCFTPNSPKASCFTPDSRKASCFTPDSRKGSFISPYGSWASGSGGSRCLSERELHSLCCDDDDDEEEEGRSSLVRSSRLSSSDSVFSSPPPPLHPLAIATLTPGHRRKMQRSCATQTVSDKSTQTAWPCVSNKDIRAHRETKSLCFKEGP